MFIFNRQKRSKWLQNHDSAMVIFFSQFLFSERSVINTIRTPFPNAHRHRLMVCTYLLYACIK